MTNAVSLAQQASTGVSQGFKNRIINGAMMIDQRNAGASVTPIDGQYTLDRWTFNLAQASKLTCQQNAGSVTPPAGFTNYLGLTSTSAYSVVSTDSFDLDQYIEGLNIADLGWGTASAKTVTLSAWVYSSLTGTFGGVLQNSANNYTYPFTYSIPVANTWTQISVTVTGATSGTWLTTNGAGIRLRFSVGAGSSRTGTAGSWTTTSSIFGATGQTSVVGTNGATFYITGVQLEVGSTATSFDYRPYGTELQLCQRYYEKSYNIDVVAGTAGNYLGITKIQGTTDVSSNASAQVSFKVPKRVNATMTYFNAGSGASGTWDYARSGASGSPTANSDQPSMGGVLVYGAAGAAYTAVNWAGHWVASAEL